MAEKCCMLIPCPLTNVVGADRLLTPCPLTPSLDWHWRCRQDAAHIIHVRYDSLKSQCHWWSRGLVWLLPAFKRHLYNWLLLSDDPDIKCPWQSDRVRASLMTLCLLSVIGWVSIWVHCCSSFLLLQWSFVYKMLSDSIPVRITYAYSLPGQKGEEIWYPFLSFPYDSQLCVFDKVMGSQKLSAQLWFIRKVGT